LREPLISIHSLPGLMKSASVASRSSAVAHLVEVSDLQVGALAHGAAVGRQLAEDQLEQRGLAGAVGPIRPTLSPRRMVPEKSLTMVLARRRTC
jgi:hypothetical protein